MSNSKFEICLAVGIIALWLVFEYPATFFEGLFADFIPSEFLGYLSDDNEYRQIGTARILALLAGLFLAWRIVFSFSRAMFGQRP